jgi:hypothetical protein
VKHGGGCPATFTVAAFALSRTIAPFSLCPHINSIMTYSFVVFSFNRFDLPQRLAAVPLVCQSIANFALPNLRLADLALNPGN